MTIEVTITCSGKKVQDVMEYLVRHIPDITELRMYSQIGDYSVTFTAHNFETVDNIHDGISWILRGD